MNIAALTLAFLLVSLLGGCLKAGGEGETPEARVSFGAIEPSANHSIAMRGCSAFAFSWTIPPSAHSGSIPPGWERSDFLFGGIGLRGYDCQSIVIGEFDWGPVRLVFEMHAGADTPPACDRGITPQMHDGVASTTWVNDAELGAYLNNTYEIPIIVAQIDRQDSQVPGASRSIWTWAVPGQKASQISMQAATTYADSAFEGQMTFWPYREGIVRFFITSEFDLHAAFAAGTFQPPMLMAQFAGGAYGGYGQVDLRGDAEGEFTLFQDRFCEEPLG